MDIIKTGFSVIDGVIGGFNASELVVIAGRPGMRKDPNGFLYARNGKHQLCKSFDIECVQY